MLAATLVLFVNGVSKSHGSLVAKVLPDGSVHYITFQMTPVNNGPHEETMLFIWLAF